jgi:hypothetical protein
MWKKGKMNAVPMTKREMEVMIKILKHTVPDLDDQEVVMSLVTRLEILLRL